jgi:hypothetical protein
MDNRASGAFEYLLDLVVVQGKERHLRHPVESSIEQARRNTNPPEHPCRSNLQAVPCPPAREGGLIRGNARRKLDDDRPSGSEHSDEFTEEGLGRRRRLQVLEDEETQDEIEGTVWYPTQIIAIIEHELTVVSVREKLPSGVDHARCDVDTRHSREISAQPTGEPADAATEVESSLAALPYSQLICLREDVSHSAFTTLKELCNVSAPVSVLGIGQDCVEGVDRAPVVPGPSVWGRCHPTPFR